MSSLRIFSSICTAIIVWVVSTTTLPAATRVDLVINEPQPNRQVAWPVTTGVPFPRGGLVQVEHCRLIDDQGKEQLLQAKTVAWWDKDRSSIRWLTIDFIAQPGRKYALEFGPDVQRANFAASPMIVDADSLTVNTGALQVQFRARGGSPLQAVRVDFNGDGRIGPDEIVAGGEEHCYDTLRAKAEANSDDEHDIVVETIGPVRACIRVDGWYSGPAGERIVRYRTRYHLFAGLQVMKLIDEFRIVGSTQKTEFRDISSQLNLKLETNGRRITAGIAGLPDKQLVESSWNADTVSVALTQQKYRHLGNLECNGQFAEATTSGSKSHYSGERVGPWLQVADRRAAITGSLRWFWQQFPKGWMASADQLALQLWPASEGTLDFSEAGIRRFFGPAGNKYLLDSQNARPSRTPVEQFFYFAGRLALERDGADGLGINKHHEIWYHFAPIAKAAEGIEYGRLADEQPLCLASGEWNCSTDVFGPLAARPNNSPYEAAVDRIFDLERYAQDHFGDYGWWLFGAGPHYSYQWDPETKRHYADPRRFEYHTYQRETQLWWCYLRSGERKFHDWCIPSENHWVDIAVSHAPTQYSTNWRGGSAEDAKLIWATGDWSIDSPMYHVRHHDTGEAWLRSAPQYWATYHRTLETTSLAHYLTGDERYNDVIDFWRKYWAMMAGVRSDSRDVPPIVREQLWFKPTPPSEPSKSWAEMLRDYAPFRSGSRHQMTLFFNLATLYEHTWDPVIRRVLDDYAAAFLDPAHPIGVWRSQDNNLPTRSDSPSLAHYWSSALWKYARATGDPRMPEILRRYFMTGYFADPFAEDVGVYSNVQIAWAWYFTRDPRHLAPLTHELERLLPFANALNKPEELGPRIYNPHHPPEVLTAVPRLVAALADARKQGIEPGPRSLTPQRTLIALRSIANQPITATLWGWDKTPTLIDAQGKPVATVAERAVHKSHRTPFDRIPRDYEVHRVVMNVAPKPQANWYFVVPKIELGVPETVGIDAIVCWAGVPVQVDPAARVAWRVPTGQRKVTLETSQPKLLRVASNQRELPCEKVGNTIHISLDDVANGSVEIENTASVPLWFRFQNATAENCWVSPRGADSAVPPSFPVGWEPPTDSSPSNSLDTMGPRFVPGKFGSALVIVPGNDLQIPDELPDASGKMRRLSDLQKGTIEFWIRRRWDDRLKPRNPMELLTNGQIRVLSPTQLPLDEWAHVAVVWHTVVGSSPPRTLGHVYVDGRDYAYYRSIDWEGYASSTILIARPWLGKFVLRADPGISYEIDDLRISSAPRYLNADVKLGREQTFNPFVFEPSGRPCEVDRLTLIYLPFDGNLQGKTAEGVIIEAIASQKKK